MTKSNKTMTRLKRLLILAGILILLIFLLRVYEHKDQELTGVPDAVGSTVSGGTCSLTVTANVERISDREAFAREVVRMCRENSFRSLRLSTDMAGWPEELDIKVYLRREDIGEKEPVMRILYEPADTDADISIQDDPEKYILTIE